MARTTTLPSPAAVVPSAPPTSASSMAGKVPEAVVPSGRRMVKMTPSMTSLRITIRNGASGVSPAIGCASTDARSASSSFALTLSARSLQFEPPAALRSKVTAGE